MKTQAMGNTATKQEYITLDDAYNYFNKVLFNNELSPCLITFQRQKKSLGYYSHNRFKSRIEKAHISELALAINHFERQKDCDIFQTLVHEMCHHWQYTLGKPSRNGYHNWEFARKMESVGLMTSSTGKEGGNRVGQKMSDYVIKGGVFEKACNDLINKGYKINWQSYEYTDDKKKPKKNTKIKYTCPECDCNAWGKDGLNLVCGDCQEIMESIG